MEADDATVGRLVGCFDVRSFLALSCKWDPVALDARSAWGRRGGGITTHTQTHCTNDLLSGNPTTNRRTPTAATRFQINKSISWTLSLGLPSRPMQSSDSLPDWPVLINCCRSHVHCSAPRTSHWAPAMTWTCCSCPS